jgi:polar amino acid transport system permease protein
LIEAVSKAQRFGVRRGFETISKQCPSTAPESVIASSLNYFQRMRYIVLPQALGVTIPHMLGQAIVLVKDSALLSLISIPELTRAGQIMTSERFIPAEGFLTTAAFYLVIF